MMEGTLNKPDNIGHGTQLCCFKKVGGGGFSVGSDGNEFACNAGDLGSIPLLGRFPWRKEGLPTPVFLPGQLINFG